MVDLYKKKTRWVFVTKHALSVYENMMDSYNKMWLVFIRKQSGLL